jgi:2-methylisocitrate lyase-like PEP mutase family enzyme
MNGTETRTKPTTKLRELLAQEKYILMPGCYDVLSARLIQEAGFQTAAISGFAFEVAVLGYPDLGLMTLPEISGQARRITNNVNIPVISDADTGFGGVQNIHRAIRELEWAGLAGVHIEDQANPKQCPVLPGRRLASIAEAAERYAVAAEARTDPDFVIIARSDGDSVSYDEQMERANAYLQAGADVAMPMWFEYNGQSFSGLAPDRQMEVIGRAVRDIHGPVMFVGDAPRGYSYADLGKLGVKVLSPSLVTMDAAARAMKDVLAILKLTESTAGYRDDLSSGSLESREYLDLMGVNYYLDLELRHTTQSVR